MGKPLKIKNIILASVPFALNLSVLLVYVFILKQENKLPIAFNYQFGNIISALFNPSFTLVKSFSYYAISSSIALGLFLLPLTISHVKNHFMQLKRSWVLKTIVLSYLLIVLLKVLLSPNPMPFVGNLIYSLGLGPIIITGFNSNEIVPNSYFLMIFWKSLNLVGALSFSCIILSILNSLFYKKENRNNRDIYSIGLMLILYLAPICLSYANDRYLLFVIPFLILAYILSFELKIKTGLFLTTFIPIFLFSLVGTHDYMGFHRTRWKAGNQLLQQAIAPNLIDGGFEFNAWHLYGSKNYNPNHTGRWWWIENDEFIITPYFIDGYTIESTYISDMWLVKDLEHIYVLRKNL